MRAPRHSRGACAGYTLIEVMVALMIFALTSGIAYRGLDAVLAARARVAAEAERWRDLAMAFLSMQQAFATAVDRPVKARDGNVADAFIATARPRGDEPPLAFTRMAPAYPPASGEARRVGYRVVEGRLEQWLWPVLDQGPRSDPVVVGLATGISAMELRFLTAAGAWVAVWPLTPDRAALPAAVEVTLSLDSGERLTRLFVLP